MTQKNMMRRISVTVAWIQGECVYADPNNFAFNKPLRGFFAKAREMQNTLFIHAAVLRRLPPKPRPASMRQHNGFFRDDAVNFFPLLEIVNGNSVIGIQIRTAGDIDDASGPISSCKVKSVTDLPSFSE